jgi:hypothetical protein
MYDLQQAIIEAHSLLTISPENRDEEWESDREAWLKKWEAAVLSNPPEVEAKLP